MKIFIFLLTFGVASAGHKIPWWNIQAAQKQGPNVCVVEQVPDTHRKYFTECKYWRPRLICGKQTIIKYECCEGYQIVPGQPGCTGVKPLMNVVETARSVGARKFANFLEKTGIAEELGRDSAVTLFAPTDESFDAYLRIYGGIKPERITTKKYRDLATYHFAAKKILSKQWGADLLIDSKLPGHKIRINKYSNGMETVNCEVVVRKNQQATNGVVHVIDGVLLPDRYQNANIVEAIIADGRFNVLAGVLRNSDTAKRLVDDNAPRTFFAPSDEAFQKISPSRLNQIFNDKDALEALIANHIITHPICLPGIISKHHGKTLGMEKLTLDCTSHGPTVENQRLRQDFLHGPDGLVYLIDDVLLPDRAKTVTELAGDEKLTAFTDLIRNAGLEEAFDNFNSYTLFAPSDAAMYSLPEGELEYMKRDRDRAQKFVLTHAVAGRHTTDGIYDNQIVTSLDEKTRLRIQVYRGSVGIEDATIEKADVLGRNGVLHIINKALRPNTDSLDEVLSTNGNFSIWLAAMDRMREIQPQEFEEFRRTPEISSHTYFVPSDGAFRELGEAKLGRLMGDSAYLAKTMRNHVADNMMSVGGFKRDLQYAIRTKQNTAGIVKKNNTMKINGATMTKCDMLNRNGVAHEINKVLLPEDDFGRRHYFKRISRASRRAKTARAFYSHSDRRPNFQ